MLVYKLPSAEASMLTISTTALSVEEAISAVSEYSLPSEINSITLFIESGSIRWLDDGNTPTSTAGHLASSSGRNTITLDGSTINKFKMIRTGTVDATVTIRVGLLTK